MQVKTDRVKKRFLGTIFYGWQAGKNCLIGFKNALFRYLVRVFADTSIQVMEVAA